MARRPVKRENTQLDPMFYKPDDVRDMEYLDPDLIETSTDFTDDEFGTVIIDPDDPSEFGLPVPEFITVVEQIIHKNYTGQDVVDIVIEIDDFINVDHWNVRYSKVTT